MSGLQTTEEDPEERYWNEKMADRQRQFERQLGGFVERGFVEAMKASSEAPKTLAKAKPEEWTGDKRDAKKQKCEPTSSEKINCYCSQQSERLKG